jgi:hypothetical protein
MMFSRNITAMKATMVMSAAMAFPGFAAALRSL